MYDYFVLVSMFDHTVPRISSHFFIFWDVQAYFELTDESKFLTLVGFSPRIQGFETKLLL